MSVPPLSMHRPVKRRLAGGEARDLLLGRARVAAEDAEDAEETGGAGYHDGWGCCGVDLEGPAARNLKPRCAGCGGTLVYHGQRCACGCKNAARGHGRPTETR